MKTPGLVLKGLLALFFLSGIMGGLPSIAHKQTKNYLRVAPITHCINTAVYKSASFIFVFLILPP
jgi:hypothetical protein